MLTPLTKYPYSAGIFLIFGVIHNPIYISGKDCIYENPYMRNVCTMVLSYAYLIFTRCLMITRLLTNETQFPPP
jgi:hypothetical protein